MKSQGKEQETTATAVVRSETAVLCSACGDPITAAELCAMFRDDDFVPHGNRGHLAAFHPTDRNYRTANEVARRAP